MRFRAVVAAPGTFLQIVQSISKLAKRCVLHFDQDKAALICADETEGGVQVWSQITKDSLFGSYRIESNQPESSIHLSLAVGPLLAVLRSAVAHQAKGEIVLKLAKRPQAGVGNGEDKVLRPMLVWEIGGDSRTGRAPPLAHELPIRVLKPPEVAALVEPLCPDPDIHILLPPLSLLRTIARHLEPLASHVAVSASASGRQDGLGVFRLVAGRGEGKGVEVATEWKGLKVPKVADAPEPSSSSSQHDPATLAPKFHTTHIALRSLLRFLTAHTIVGSTIACVCAGHSLILYLYIGDVDRAGGVLTFFLPAVVVEDEDE